MLIITPDHPAAQYIDPNTPAWGPGASDQPQPADNGDVGSTTGGSWDAGVVSPADRGAAIEAARPTDAPAFSFQDFLNSVGQGLGNVAQGALSGMTGINPDQPVGPDNLGLAGTPSVQAAAASSQKPPSTMGPGDVANIAATAAQPIEAVGNAVNPKTIATAAAQRVLDAEGKSLKPEQSFPVITGAADLASSLTTPGGILPKAGEFEAAAQAAPSLTDALASKGIGLVGPAMHTAAPSDVVAGMGPDMTRLLPRRAPPGSFESGEPPTPSDFKQFMSSLTAMHPADVKALAEDIKANPQAYQGSAWKSQAILDHADALSAKDEVMTSLGPTEAPADKMAAQRAGVAGVNGEGLAPANRMRIAPDQQTALPAPTRQPESWTDPKTGQVYSMGRVRVRQGPTGGEVPPTQWEPTTTPVDNAGLPLTAGSPTDVSRFEPSGTIEGKPGATSKFSPDATQIGIRTGDRVVTPTNLSRPDNVGLGIQDEDGVFPGRFGDVPPSPTTADRPEAMVSSQPGTAGSSTVDQLADSRRALEELKQRQALGQASAASKKVEGVAAQRAVESPEAAAAKERFLTALHDKGINEGDVSERLGGGEGGPTSEQSFGTTMDNIRSTRQAVADANPGVSLGNASTDAGGSVTINPRDPDRVLPPMAGGATGQRPKFGGDIAKRFNQSRGAATRSMERVQNAALRSTEAREALAAGDDKVVGPSLAAYQGDSEFLQDLKQKYISGDKGLTPGQWQAAAKSLGVLRPASERVDELAGPAASTVETVQAKKLVQGYLNAAQPARKDGPAVEEAFAAHAGQRAQAMVEIMQAAREAKDGLHGPEARQVVAKAMEPLAGRLLEAGTDLVSDVKDAGNLVKGLRPDPLPDGRSFVPVRGATGWWATPNTERALYNTFGHNMPAFLGDATLDASSLDGMFGADQAKGLRKLMALQGVAKETILAVSGFHFATLSRQIGRAAVAANNVEEGANILHAAWKNTLVPGANKAFRASPAVKDIFSRAASVGVTLLEPGSVGAFGPDVEKTGVLPATKALAGGLEKVSAGRFDPSAAAVSRTLLRSLMGGATGAALGGGQAAMAGGSPQDVAEGALKWGLVGAVTTPIGASVVGNALWGRFVPTAKALTWNMLKDSMGERAAAEHVNNIFGGQNLEAMARNPMMSVALHAFMLAPDWVESALKSVGSIAASGPRGAAARKFIPVSLAGAFLTTQAMQQAIDGHFTWDNGPDHWWEVNLNKFMDDHGMNRGFQDPSGRSGNHDFYVNVLGLGPIPSIVKSLVTRQFLALAVNHASPGMGTAAQFLSNRNIGGKPIVPGTPAEQALPSALAGVVSRNAPISMSGVSKKNMPPAISIPAQLTGSQVTVGKARNPAIDEAKRLGMGGQAGWPTPVRTGERLVIPAAIRGRNTPEEGVDLTPQEAARFNDTVNAWLPYRYAADRATYDQLPNVGKPWKEINSGLAAAALTKWTPDRIRRLGGGKPAYLTWAEELTRQQILQSLVTDLRQRGQYAARVQASATKAATTAQGKITAPAPQ